jgi:hypothetical protein
MGQGVVVLDIRAGEVADRLLGSVARAIGREHLREPEIGGRSIMLTSMTVQRSARTGQACARTPREGRAFLNRYPDLHAPPRGSGDTFLRPGEAFAQERDLQAGSESPRKRH